MTDSRGTGNSSFVEERPILDLFRPGGTKLLDIETEPEGSISQGETLPCLLISPSSHLT